ncbi:MAG: Hsp20/alpha crystallin family protein [Desulfobulbaceae bacterium]|nr:Hsp20/alpha crystallin family protein [Desulfobulbaceae bacterium]
MRGEKQQKKEGKEKNYYLIERSYGSFQRILTLPDDANHDEVQATFKNKVLTVIRPNKA